MEVALVKLQLTTEKVCPLLGPGEGGAAVHAAGQQRGVGA